jgi:hypothetical protein
VPVPVPVAVEATATIEATPDSNYLDGYMIIDVQPNDYCVAGDSIADVCTMVDAVANDAVATCNGADCNEPEINLCVAIANPNTPVYCMDVTAITPERKSSEVKTCGIAQLSNNGVGRSWTYGRCWCTAVGRSWQSRKLLPFGRAGPLLKSRGHTYDCSSAMADF